MHTSTHTVLYDPEGLIEAELPLDREPYECLVKAVLAWTGQEAGRTRLRADRSPAHRPRPRRRLQRPPPRRPSAEGQRPAGSRRHRPARSGRPAVRDDRGHRALRPEPRPPAPGPLRTAGPPGHRAHAGQVAPPLGARYGRASSGGLSSSVECVSLSQSSSRESGLSSPAALSSPCATAWATRSLILVCAKRWLISMSGISLLKSCWFLRARCVRRAARAFSRRVRARRSYE